MKRLTKFLFVLVSLIPFVATSAQALSCKSIVGVKSGSPSTAKMLTIHVITQRLRQGVQKADGILQNFVPAGAVEGFYSSVAVGKSPAEAQNLILKASRTQMYAPAQNSPAARAYYTAVGTGLSPAEVSHRIKAAAPHQTRSFGVHGLVEGYYLAVAFGQAPFEAAALVSQQRQQSIFPNIESYTDFLSAFYAGLAFGVPLQEVRENLTQARQQRGVLTGSGRAGVLSGYYFAAALRGGLEE